MPRTRQAGTRSAADKRVLHRHLELLFERHLPAEGACALIADRHSEFAPRRRAVVAQATWPGRCLGQFELRRRRIVRRVTVAIAVTRITTARRWLTAIIDARKANRVRANRDPRAGSVVGHHPEWRNAHAAIINARAIVDETCAGSRHD